MANDFLTRSKLIKKSGKLDRLLENVDIPDSMGTIEWKKDGFYLFTYSKQPEVIENDLPEM